MPIGHKIVGLRKQCYMQVHKLNVDYTRAYLTDAVIVIIHFILEQSYLRGHHSVHGEADIGSTYQSLHTYGAKTLAISVNVSVFIIYEETI